MTSSTSCSKTTYTVLCGLFASLTAVCSLITIPLPFTPVPINLGTLAVFLSGGLLGRKYGTISITIYILMGAVGLPVYAGFAGGIGILAGPTGGFFAGYLAAAFLIGWLMETSCKGQSILCAVFMALGLLACYGLGTLWFMVNTGTGLWSALAACVFPFLPADALKISAAVLLVQKLRPFLGGMEVL